MAIIPDCAGSHVGLQRRINADGRWIVADWMAFLSPNQHCWKHRANEIKYGK